MVTIVTSHSSCAQFVHLIDKSIIILKIEIGQKETQNPR